MHFTPETVATAFRVAGLEPVAVTTPTYLAGDIQPEELAAALAHPGWTSRLRRLSPGTDPERAAGPAARAVGAVVQRVQEHRGRGSALLAIARRPS